MDGKTEDGGTQPYYNEKGKEPIVIGAGKKLTPQMISAAKKGTPDSYISFVVSMNGAEYSPSNFNDMGTQLVEAVDAYEHESQHIELITNSIINEGVRLDSGIQHDRMRSGSLYEDRVNVLLELKRFWVRTYEKRRETLGWTQEYFIKYISNGFKR